MGGGLGSDGGLGLAQVNSRLRFLFRWATLCFQVKLVLLHGLLDPLAEICLVESLEELLLGRLEVDCDSLRSTILTELWSQHPLGREQARRDGRRFAPGHQTQPATEQRRLGQPGRVAVFLQEKHPQIHKLHLRCIQTRTSAA